MRPKITKTLKGALGETYYKELCAQKGWAYCSLEAIHNCKDLGNVVFKMGFDRIRVSIPKPLRPEVARISKPSNSDAQNPSFVFDYLACKACGDASRMLYPAKGDFCWAEIKTGLGIFSDNQYKTLSEIQLPIAVFHVEDVMTRPQYIDMDWDIMSGKEFARTLDNYGTDEDGPHYSQDSNYYGNVKLNTSHSYGSNYDSNHNSQRGGITAKFSSTCKICRRRIVAGKDKVGQNDYGNWVHARCAS